MRLPSSFRLHCAILPWRGSVIRLALAAALATAATMAFAAAAAAASDPAASAATARAQTATEAMGERFAAAITAGDGAALNAMIDVSALATRVLDGLELNAADRLRYVTGLRMQYAALGESVALQMRAQNARGDFVRALPREEGAAFMVRITTRDARDNMGHGYLEVEVDDAGRIVDWYDHAVALSMSGQLRFTAGSMLTTAQFSRLLLGKSDESIEGAATMRTFVSTLQVGDFAGAYASLVRLPASMQERRELATLRVALSRYVGMDAYRDELAKLAEQHGDARELQFLLIDHHLFTNEHDRALAAINGAAQTIGDDEVLETNRCHVYLAQGRKADAVAACDRAIALDPRFETPRWTRTRIGLETQDAAIAMASLRGVEEATGEQLDAAALGRNKVYAWLVEQPEWAPWATQRGWSAPQGSR